MPRSGFDITASIGCAPATGGWPSQGRRLGLPLPRWPIGLARLADWPFALKMAFCPALAVLVLMGMGLHGILAANGQVALIRAVAHHDLAVAVRLSQSAAMLQGINGSLYRLTTLQASKAPNLNVAGESGRLATL
ncbi:MAG TPA: hypothetical protein VJ779_18360, partial [Acetobacteraceae bacterium]|nr:hypothetical protein [Acetobacteraceae bacterium]